ncbi:kinase [Thraustotheca clavata]|uniref:Kinase n=1 Tax=Thraustotheca clavata TaxID=74557 RepID=A0A1W0A659_9STRA|nr:kinase [Thraustotheca clavata]
MLAIILFFVSAIAAQTITNASCKYASYGRNVSVYTGDETCRLPGSSCIIDAYSCNITNMVSMPNGSWVSPWTGEDLNLVVPEFNAIGDFTQSNVSMSSFICTDTPTLIMKDMALPKTVVKIYLGNITTMDFGSITKPFPPSLQTINIYSSGLGIFPINFKWPSVVNISLPDNSLQTIPKGLPKTLQGLSVQNNSITDLNYLPPNLTFLNLRNNQITSISNQDWQLMKSIFNPVTSITNIKLSNKLFYFACIDCLITNLTINNETYQALNALQWAESYTIGFRMTKDIVIDPSSCTAISGTVMPLWANKSKNTFTACVIPDTGVIIGCTVGGVALIAIIVFFVVRRNKKQDQTFYYENPTTGNGTQGSAGDNSEMGLNVEELRVHKLDLADLKVTAKKPIASGAYGEVWLGTYLEEKVAIKRIKDRRIESVKKFIEEIKLMSIMESEFIVKFIGVSWRRPIEMEVIVEYMDFGDLRNYLMNRKASQFDWNEKFSCIMSIVRGLVYLHTFDPPIIHRDLKSRNVLLDSKKGTKLTDFGTSRQEADTNMTNGIGTYQWMAPEVIMGTEYTIAADIYSFGVILSEFSTHAVPYSDVKNPATGRLYTQQAIMSKVTAGEVHPTFDQTETPGWVRDLGVQCMALNPSDRPTALGVTVTLQRYIQNVFSSTLSNNNMINIPQGLPKNLETLAIQNNGLTDLMYLPENNISFLNLYGNSLHEVTNRKWEALTFFLNHHRNLGQNPLETIAFVQLSTKLEFFFCKYCHLTNITIDATTAAALNALKPWSGNDSNLTGFAIDKNISTNAPACTSLGGSIQSIFQGQKNLSVTACVLSNTSATPIPSIGTSNSTNMGLIAVVISVVIAALAICIAIFIFIRSKKQANLTSLPMKKDDKNKNKGDASTQGTGITQSTGNSQESGGRIASQLDHDVVDLDVSLLRYHRLELSDLIVLGNKPLASGAYGEVWRGTYGGQQVAIKRTKSRKPRQVQKFIDEIILMSQLDCDYIVKFIGASWTKPIEIECVVEYMDLGDLRSYLVNQSSSQFTWDQKYQSIVSIARGLLYLHTYTPPIIHRDLKSRNVLLDTKKGTKFTDFGTSRTAEENDIMTSGIGTYQWMAPEVISGTHYSSPADIFSFGIILSEFATHQVPYSGMLHPQTGKILAQHALLQEVQAGRVYPSFEGENVPSWVKDVGMQCLQLNENERPTALQLCASLSVVNTLSN